MGRCARRAAMFKLIEKYTFGIQTRREFCTYHKILLSTFGWWMHEYRKSNTSGAKEPEFIRLNPLSGELFVFVNKRCDRMKILVWDRHGFWLLYKRLEAGRFQMPLREELENPGSLATT